MISPDLAETVKRLRELAGKATPGPWEWGKYTLDAILAEPFPGMRQAVLGAQHEYDSGTNVTCSEADAAYIAAANPAAISSILDALEGLERDLADAHARARALTGERNAAYRGRMEWFERATKAESSLAEARKGARTPGSIEICPRCGVPLTYENGDRGGIDGCDGCGDPVEGGPVSCPMRSAQHPTAPQETAP